MGCTTSKLDDLPALTLCRHRCSFLDEAIHRRYALAQAHAAYLHSLKQLSFFLTPLLVNQPDPPASPAPPIPLSHSNSGSHLEFNSHSEDEDSDSESLPHRHHHLDNDHFTYADHETLGLFPDGYKYNTNMNYMKNQTTPSVVYEQNPPGPETVHRISSYHPYPNLNYGAFFDKPPSQAQLQASASSSSQPPPPPPTTTSGWEFLNPFESFESNWREDEEIPELESEDELPEIVKEVHEETNSSDDSSNHLKRTADNDGDPQSPTEDPVLDDKNVVKEEKKEEPAKPVENVAISKNFRDDGEVLKEIQIQFERASDSGDDIAKILEVGKLPYNRKHSVYQDSTKMLTVTGQLSTTSPVESLDPQEYSDIDGDCGVGSSNHSSTLKKIYFWEMKLYQEVKIEEKMRILHERKCRKLKKLDEKGAEAHKINDTRVLVRSLATKINIAIQVVDRISIKINMLRDEELWPQLNEIIQGLRKMWKSMLECHKSQSRAISQAKKLDTIASLKNLTEADIEASLQLQREVINWTLRFSCWVTAQKDYSRALNNWLLKCFLYEPEETCDGVAPFSPGRVGAPPVFVAVNQWSQALEMVSEKEVVDSMRDFATSAFRVWERDKPAIGQRKIEKEIAALEKMMVESCNFESRGVVYQSDTSNIAHTSLQSSMQHVFQAMEKFTASLVASYEELSQRMENDVVYKADKTQNDSDAVVEYHRF